MLGATLGVQCDRSKAQARHPAFGALSYELDRLLIHRKAERLAQERRHLVAREAQRAAPNLNQLATGAQGCQGERRVVARAQGEVQRAGWMEQQSVDQLMHIPAADPMVIVQRQDKTLPGAQLAGVSQAVDAIVERGAQHRQWRQFGRLQQRLQLGAGIREERANGGDQVGQEGCQIAVAFVERKPRAGAGSACQPLAQQRRLAKAGRCAHQRERSIRVMRQALLCAHQRHQAAGDPGPVEFGLYDERRRQSGRHNLQLHPCRGIGSGAGGLGVHTFCPASPWSSAWQPWPSIWLLSVSAIYFLPIDPVPYKTCSLPVARQVMLRSSGRSSERNRI